MSDKYAAVGIQTASEPTPGDSCLSLQGVTTLRARIYDLVFSQGSTPADVVCQWLVRRFNTADGTGDAVTAEPLDNDAPASALTVQEEHTVEPTDAAVIPLLDFDLNQRATFRWVAAPGGEIMVPALATEGIYMTELGTYVGISRVTAHWDE